MAGGVWFIVGLLLVAEPAFGQGCAGTGASAHTPAPHPVQDWIASDLAFYAVDAGHGAVKIEPRTGTVTPLGGPHGEPGPPIELSPDKRWLSASFSNHDSTWSTYLEETGTGREIALPDTRDDTEFTVFAPDRAAVFSAANNADIVRIVDLASGTRHTITLGPAHGLHPGALDEVPGAAWHDGQLLLLLAQGEGYAAWSLDPATSARTPIDAKTAKDPLFDRRMDFIENGQVIASSCRQCDGRKILETLDLAGGMRVERKTLDIWSGHETITLVHKDGTRSLLVETQPRKPDADGNYTFSACAPDPTALFAAPDAGQYLLYRVQDTYWLYGVRVDKTVDVWHGRSYMRW